MICIFTFFDRVTVSWLSHLFISAATISPSIPTLFIYYLLLNYLLVGVWLLPTRLLFWSLQAPVGSEVAAKEALQRTGAGEVSVLTWGK